MWHIGCPRWVKGSALPSGHGSHAARRAAGKFCRPCVEALEDRHVLSAAVLPFDPVTAAGSPVQTGPAIIGTTGTSTQAGQLSFSWRGVPATSTGATVTAVVGQPFLGVVAAFTLPDATTVRASIDWGDGSQSPGFLTPDGSGSQDVIGTTTYSRAGSFILTLTLTRAGAGPRTIRSMASVTSGLPGAAQSGSQDQGSGSVVTLSAVGFGITFVFVPKGAENDTGISFARPSYRELHQRPIDVTGQSVYRGQIDPGVGSIPPPPAAAIPRGSAIPQANARPIGSGNGVRTTPAGAGDGPRSLNPIMARDREAVLAVAAKTTGRTAIVALTPVELDAGKGETAPGSSRSPLPGEEGKGAPVTLAVALAPEVREPEDGRSDLPDNYFAPLQVFEQSAGPYPGRAAPPAAVVREPDSQPHSLVRKSAGWPGWVRAPFWAAAALLVCRSLWRSQTALGSSRRSR